MYKTRIGQRIAPAHLAELDESGAIHTVHAEMLLAGCKALIIGVPGAFTPNCTHQHLPDFIARAPQIPAGRLYQADLHLAQRSLRARRLGQRHAQTGERQNPP